MIYHCSKCGLSQEKIKTDKRKSAKEWVYINKDNIQVKGRICAQCANKKQAENRRNSGNKVTKNYEKTIPGFLMRKYRNMMSRVTGIQKQKHHLYFGMELLSKDEFYNWAINHTDFNRMFDVYKKSGFQRSLCPTVDRIDSSKGYVLNNMRWLTHSQNSSLGAISNRDKARAILINNSKTMSPFD